MPEAGSNGYASAQRWVDEYEKHELDKQHIMMDAAAKVADGPGKFMKEVVERAKNDGIPVKIFKAALLERKHLKNAAKVRDKIDDELQDELDLMRERLAPVADLPIFGAAIASAEKDAKRSAQTKARAEAIDSLTDTDDADLRPRHLREQGDGQTDAERLAAGIKPLAH